MKKIKITKKYQGFTLIELMTVIAIIGILAGVVLVSSGTSVDKSKKASALATASSALSELVTCQDDGGQATSAAPTAGQLICCKAANACANIAANQVAGHTATWQALTNTGWSYASGSATDSVKNGTYIFTLTKDGTGGTGSNLITCDMQANTCN